MIIHKAIGVEWDQRSACGKSSKLPNGEDATPRTVHDSQVTCKLCLRAIGASIVSPIADVPTSDAVKSPGQLAYELDVLSTPKHDDGTPRPSFSALPDFARETWEKNPTARQPNRCQCHDTGDGHPVNPGINSTRCSNEYSTILYRVDMDDQTGTRFCDDCASDAMKSGLYTDEAQAESEDCECGRPVSECATSEGYEFHMDLDDYQNGERFDDSEDGEL